jgi:glutamyl-tRNA synthetase
MLRFTCRPTRDMTMDDLRVALLNFIVAKQRKEELIARIEDTDKEKNIENKDQEILDILALFGIEYSQVIYQSQNYRFHSAMALQLLHEKKAFSCFCSSGWLENKRKEAKAKKQAYRYDGACENLPAELVIDNMNPFTVRIKEPEDAAVDSFVIMNQEKIPSDIFATAIDDMLSDISLVICDENSISDAPKQEHVRKSLNYDKTLEYAHIPSIDDDFLSVKWFLEEGYLPSAISNYLISIGSKPPKEIFDLKEAIEWFNLDHISESPAHFDIEKLKLINREHLKNLDNKELSRYVGFADEEIGALAKIYLEEVATTKELRTKIQAIFDTKVIPEEYSESVQVMKEVIQAAPYFDKYDDFKNYIMKESNLSEEDFLKPLSLLLTGSKDAPDVALVYKHLKNYIGEIVK